jgi:hypothetical protein
METRKHRRLLLKALFPCFVFLWFCVGFPAQRPMSGVVTVAVLTSQQSDPRIGSDETPQRVHQLITTTRRPG